MDRDGGVAVKREVRSPRLRPVVMLLLSIAAAIPTVVTVVACVNTYNLGRRIDADEEIQNAWNKRIGDTTLTGNGTPSSPFDTTLAPAEPVAPVAPESCNTKPTAAEQWWCLYRAEVKMFSDATRSGFAAPAPVRNQGNHIAMDGLTIDWSHPVGFAVIDCDNVATMLDGKTPPVTIQWDAKRSCLLVTKAVRQ